MGITIFKFSFGEVYCRLYVRKLCFTAPLMVAIKRNFRQDIRGYTSQYSYPLNKHPRVLQFMRPETYVGKYAKVPVQFLVLFFHQCYRWGGGGVEMGHIIDKFL